MDSLLCVRRCIKHFTHFIVYNAPASLWVAIGIPTVAEKVEPEKLPRITHLLSSGTAQVADHVQWHTVDLCVVYMPAHRPLPDRSNPIHCSDHPLEHRISCALVICFKPGLPNFLWDRAWSHTSFVLPYIMRPKIRLVSLQPWDISRTSFPCFCPRDKRRSDNSAGWFYTTIFYSEILPSMCT